MIDPSAKRIFDYYWNTIPPESKIFMATNFIEQMRANVREIDCLETRCENQENLKEFFLYAIDKFQTIAVPVEPDPEPPLT